MRTKNKNKRNVHVETVMLYQNLDLKSDETAKI